MYPESIEGDNHETERREDERDVHRRHAEDGALVDDHRLERRKDRAAEDGHDQAGGAELRVFPEAFEGDAVDGGEHQGHAGGDGDEAVQAGHAREEDDPEGEQDAAESEAVEHLPRLEVLHEVSADKPATAEEDHGGDVVLLREHFRIDLTHPALHEDTGAVLDDEGPAHDLHAHVEELRDHAFPVAGDAHQILQRRPDSAGVLFLDLGHSGQHDDEEHHHDDDADYHVGFDQDAQVRLAHCREFFVGEGGPGGGVHRVQARLDEVHRYEHPAQGADGIERLGEVEAPGGRGRVAHREDVRIGAGLQETEPAGKDEVGDEERPVGAGGTGRDEQERPGGVQPEPHQDAALVGEAADEDGGGKRHREVAAVEGHLGEGALRDAHPEDLGERLHHRVGDIVGETPQREARGDEDEGEQVVHSLILEKTLFLFHRFQQKVYQAER